MGTHRPSNYLVHSHHEFTDYHIRTADKIHQLIESERFRELGELKQRIPQQEAAYVHYAYLDKHETGWLSRAQRIETLFAAPSQNFMQIFFTTKSDFYKIL